MENLNTNNASSSAEMEKDYLENYVPSVNRFSQFSMALGFLLMQLPTAYCMVRYATYIEWGPMWSRFAAVLVTIFSASISTWLFEPMAMWSLMGSASCYMGYLAGGASNIRAPIAVSVQNSMDVEPHSPKGQMVTTIAVALSTFINIAVTLLTVLFGDVLISHLPAVVVAAFGFVSVCLFANMLAMRLTESGNTVVGNLKKYLPYILVAAATFAFFKIVIPTQIAWGYLVSVILCAIVGYIIYIRQEKKS